LITILPYVTAVVFFGGIIYRLLKWLAVPVPTMIMLTPAPITRIGVTKRLGLEFLGFTSLRKGGWKLWLGGWLFHLLLGLTLLTHVVTIFFPLIWVTVGYTLYRIAGYAGILFAAIISFLLFRRLVQPGVRYVSKYSDYFFIMLAFSVVFSGDYTWTFGKLDIGAVTSYFYGLLTLHPVLPPANFAFLTHFALAQLFLMYIPFSKVSHLVGWVTAPTRNQRNDARARWHRNPWNPEVQLEPWESYAARYQNELEELGPGGERR
jgi:nitrate reductase gamma subunit